jgi:tetratricopeptide (TPR) repeat protein
MPGGTSVQARVKALFGYLLNAVFAGELTRAAPVLEEGHAHDATGAHVLALQHLASANVPAGLRALEPYLAHPDPWTRGMTWLIRSFMHSATNGAAAEGRRDLDAAVAAFRESGDRWGLSLSLASVAFDRTATGDFDATAAALEESTDVIRELGPDNQQRIWLAMVRVHTGELEKARAELLSAMADTTSAYQIALGRLLLADLARFSGDLDEAARQLDLADAEATDLPAQTLYFSSQGHLALAQGDLALAKEALNRSLSAAITMPDMPMIATIAVGMAQLLHHQDEPRRAAELLGAAHALRDGPDTRHPDVQNLTQALQTALGTPAYRDAYERGRTHPAPLTLITEARSSPVSNR